MGDVFKRETDAMYSIPQRFADTKLTHCPFCRTAGPLWESREQWRLTGKDYFFRCPCCGSVLKISQEDLTGLSFTANSFAGRQKKRAGKESRTIYVRVEKIGIEVKTRENALLLGEELPLEQLLAFPDQEQ